MNELISIIVPAYNAVSYIDHLFTCLLGQTYSNLEIILVNDGSTDDTLDKCIKYAQADSRVCIVNQQNAGVSAARNRGLEEAHGEYICFIDVDDLVKDDYIEVLFHAALQEKCDVVCCGCIQTTGSYSLEEAGIYPTVRNNRMITDFRDVLGDYCKNDEQYGCVVWAKIIKRSLVECLQFEDLKYGEDTLFMQNVLMNAERIKLIDYRGYYYIRWDHSVTLSTPVIDISYAFDHYRVKKHLLQLSLQFGDAEIISQSKRIMAQQFVCLLHSHLAVDSEKYHQFISNHREEAQEIKHMENVSLIRKAEIFASLTFPRIYYYVIGWAYRRKHVPQKSKARN